MFRTVARSARLCMLRGPAVQPRYAPVAHRLYSQERHKRASPVPILAGSAYDNAVSLDVEVPAQKHTTGIAGVAVIPRAREILMRMYEQYLEDLETLLPADAPYRTHMAKVVSYRLDILKSSEDIFELEDKLPTGQLEEQIEDMEDELKLLPYVAELQPWKNEDRWRKPWIIFSETR